MTYWAYYTEIHCSFVDSKGRHHTKLFRGAQVQPLTNFLGSFI